MPRKLKKELAATAGTHVSQWGTWESNLNSTSTSLARRYLENASSLLMSASECFSFGNRSNSITEPPNCRLLHVLSQREDWLPVILRLADSAIESAKRGHCDRRW